MAWLFSSAVILCSIRDFGLRIVTCQQSCQGLLNKLGEIIDEKVNTKIKMLCDELFYVADGT